MAIQCMEKRFCAGLFTGREPVLRAGGRGSSLLLWLLMPAQGCPGCWAAWGPCSGQLPWAETRLWSLAQLKVCSLLFACRNLSASYILGGHFMGWQVQLEEIHGRLSLAAITVYPSLKHHPQKPSWAQTWAGSQWVFLLFKANIFNKKGWERARATLMSFQWSWIPPWYRCWFMSSFGSVQPSCRGTDWPVPLYRCRFWLTSVDTTTQNRRLCYLWNKHFTMETFS